MEDKVYNLTQGKEINTYEGEGKKARVDNQMDFGGSSSLNPPGERKAEWRCAIAFTVEDPFGWAKFIVWEEALRGKGESKISSWNRLLSVRIARQVACTYKRT